MSTAFASSGRLSRQPVRHRPYSSSGDQRESPRFFEAQRFFNDALRHHLAGRLDMALDFYKSALSLRPDFADAHNNLAAALAAQGKLEEATVHYRRALAFKPGHVDTHCNLGAALAAQGKIDDAFLQYKQALGIDPSHAGSHNNLGNILRARGMREAAEDHYRRAIALQPNGADAHYNLANLLARENPEQAMGHYRKAIAINPGYALAHNNLANLLTWQGELNAALMHYDVAIALQPADAEFHYNRAQLRTFRSGDADLPVLGTLSHRTDIPAGKAPFVHFAQAKAFEDMGDYVRAFEHLNRGNNLKRAQIDYDEAWMASLFRRICDTFDSDVANRFHGKGDPSPVPVFVLGMPRSGSTLIEQILASHPQIQAAGEAPYLERAIDAVSGAGALRNRYPEFVPALDGLTLRQIGQSYLGRLPALANGQLRIVNKVPQNFFYIGLIRLILPNARIVHTVRDPIDTCVSCYSTLFTLGQKFSYDLGELGRYYNYYRDLMEHWTSVLPPDSILDVAYEDVVNDIEGSARRLIEYCGLPWDDRCLAFHETRRSVSTASAVQVRRPLYRSSLQRWRRYEFGLGPLLNELERGQPAFSNNIWRTAA